MWKKLLGFANSSKKPDEAVIIITVTKDGEKVKTIRRSPSGSNLSLDAEEDKGYEGSDSSNENDDESCSVKRRRKSVNSNVHSYYATGSHFSKTGIYSPPSRKMPCRSDRDRPSSSSEYEDFDRCSEKRKKATSHTAPTSELKPSASKTALNYIMEAINGVRRKRTRNREQEHDESSLLPSSDLPSWSSSITSSPPQLEDTPAILSKRMRFIERESRYEYEDDDEMYYSSLEECEERETRRTSYPLPHLVEKSFICPDKEESLIFSYSSHDMEKEDAESVILPKSNELVISLRKRCSSRADMKNEKVGKFCTCGECDLEMNEAELVPAKQDKSTNTEREESRSIGGIEVIARPKTFCDKATCTDPDPGEYFREVFRNAKDTPHKSGRMCPDEYVDGDLIKYPKPIYTLEMHNKDKQKRIERYFRLLKNSRPGEEEEIVSKTSEAPSCSSENLDSTAERMSVQSIPIPDSSIPESKPQDSNVTSSAPFTVSFGIGNVITVPLLLNDQHEPPTNPTMQQSPTNNVFVTTPLTPQPSPTEFALQTNEVPPPPPTSLSTTTTAIPNVSSPPDSLQNSSNMTLNSLTPTNTSSGHVFPNQPTSIPPATANTNSAPAPAVEASNFSCGFGNNNTIPVTTTPINTTTPATSISPGWPPLPFHSSTPINTIAPATSISPNWPPLPFPSSNLKTESPAVTASQQNPTPTFSSAPTTSTPSIFGTSQPTNFQPIGTTLDNSFNTNAFWTKASPSFATNNLGATTSNQTVKNALGALDGLNTKSPFSWPPTNSLLGSATPTNNTFNIPWNTNQPNPQQQRASTGALGFGTNQQQQPLFTLKHNQVTQDPPRQVITARRQSKR